MTAPEQRAPEPPAPDVEAVDLLVGYGSEPDSAVTPPMTFSVARGGRLAVVGANGSGKSTLLRAVVGQLDPIRGHIRVLGHPVDERSADFRRDVSAVFDDDAYLPALTAREHVLLIARAHGMETASVFVTGLLESFGLTPRQHAAPTALSSGQRRRLLLASGFARPRRLLVLDEPEQRLDAGMRLALAQRLRSEAGTVVFASHDPELVRECATSALVLEETRATLTSAAGGARAIEELA